MEATEGPPTDPYSRAFELTIAYRSQSFYLRTHPMIITHDPGVEHTS